MAQELSYRSTQEIMRDILGLVSEPRKPTHVMYEAKLSYPQLQKFKDLLTAKGLLNIDKDGQMSITAEGKRRLQILKEACA